MKRDNGIALPFVLLALTLLLITVSTVTSRGLGSLQQAKFGQFSKQALFAAEAGASDALRRMVEDSTYAGPLGETTMENGAKYEAVITNNFAGSSPLTAPNGADVPAGMSYILGTGRFAGLERKVGLLVSGSSSTAFGMAVGAGGEIDFNGNTTIFGSMKANDEIDMNGSTRIQPYNGSGRLLSSTNIDSNGNTWVDEAQDVRAAGSIDQNPNIRGNPTVQSSDSSDATKPFINDGRTTNSLNSGEEGRLVLPNPDQAVLLADPGLVPYATDAIPSNPFNLGGKIHHFPLGLDVNSNVTINGPGTILVTGGNKIDINGNVNFDQVAMLALADDPTSGSGAIIDINGNATGSGLVYAHEEIDINGQFNLTGVLIAYRGKIDKSGNGTVTLDSTVFEDVLGFESWANGFGGLGGVPAGASPLTVAVWERL